MVESTYNWYWLVDGLMNVGYSVQLAYPDALPQYAGSKFTNDRANGQHLAKPFRLGILPPAIFKDRIPNSAKMLVG